MPTTIPKPSGRRPPCARRQAKKERLRREKENTNASASTGKSTSKSTGSNTGTSTSTSTSMITRSGSNASTGARTQAKPSLSGHVHGHDHASSIHLDTPSSSPSTPRPPRRKAILVGVSEKVEDGEGGMLPELRAHHDVKTIKSLLIDNLEFKETDIVVMMDDAGIAKHRRPTKKNIEKALKKMVRNAIPQDKFFFFYAGHGLQRKCESGTETDEMDEFIECEGGNMIKDNRLNNLLVKPLPSGCQLVALFDTCHAGTMLDLPHNACNTVCNISLAFVFVQRITRSVLNSRNATVSTVLPVSPVPLASASVTGSPPQSTPLSPLSGRLSRSGSLSMSFSSVATTTTTTTTTTSTSSASGQPARRRTGSLSVFLQTTTTTTASSATATCTAVHSDPLLSDTTSPVSAPLAHTHEESALSLVTRGRLHIEAVDCVTSSAGGAEGQHTHDRCDGTCEPQAVEGPHVISLAASADNELSFENTVGGIMTAAFVDIMRRRRTPSYGELMIELRQQFASRFRERLNTYEHYTARSIEVDPMYRSMQRPQLSSLFPLDLNQPLVI